jgi:translation initiation factor eIF-2B subunit alpha
MIAKMLRKPFYVAVESYKFARMYPLSQRDAVEMVRDMSVGPAAVPSSSGAGGSFSPERPGRHGHAHRSGSGSGADLERAGSNVGQRMSHASPRPLEEGVDEPTIDFTPADYITLLFTDLGVLTPSAVSDELIRLYQ